MIINNNHISYPIYFMSKSTENNVQSSNILKCLVNLLQTEFSIEAQKLSKSEIYSHVPPGCKRIIIKTPFKNFFLQIITNFYSYTKICFRTQNYELHSYFTYSSHEFELVLDRYKIKKYFESCNLSTNMDLCMQSINHIIETIYNSHMIENLYGLLKYHAKKIGCIYDVKEKYTFEVMRKKDSCTNNYNQNLYVQIYKELHNTMLSLNCSLFYIELLRIIILSFIGDNLTN